MLQRFRQSEMMLRENVHLSEVSSLNFAFRHDPPFSAAHLLASAHSTSLSSSRSDLLPTSTTTNWGLASALASASHLDKFAKDCRLKRD